MLGLEVHTVLCFEGHKFKFDFGQQSWYRGKQATSAEKN